MVSMLCDIDQPQCYKRLYSIFFQGFSVFLYIMTLWLVNFI